MSACRQSRRCGWLVIPRYTSCGPTVIGNVVRYIDDFAIWNVVGHIYGRHASLLRATRLCLSLKCAHKQKPSQSRAEHVYTKRRLITPVTPSRPVPSRKKLEGSGTGETVRETKVRVPPPVVSSPSIVVLALVIESPKICIEKLAGKSPPPVVSNL